MERVRTSSATTQQQLAAKIAENRGDVPEEDRARIIAHYLLPGESLRSTAAATGRSVGYIRRLIAAMIKGEK